MYDLTQLTEYLMTYFCSLTTGLSSSRDYGSLLESCMGTGICPHPRPSPLTIIPIPIKTRSFPYKLSQIFNEYILQKIINVYYITVLPYNYKKTKYLATWPQELLVDRRIYGWKRVCTITNEHGPFLNSGIRRLWLLRYYCKQLTPSPRYYRQLCPHYCGAHYSLPALRGVCHLLRSSVLAELWWHLIATNLNATNGHRLHIFLYFPVWTAVNGTV